MDRKLPWTDKELEDKLHQLRLPLDGLDKENTKHYLSKEDEKEDGMDKILRAKEVLRTITRDIPVLEELTPDSGNESIRKTPYLLTLEDIRALDTLVKLPTLVMEPIESKHGDLLTIEEFQEHVNNKRLTDYDGFGNWATETHVTNIAIWPSLFRDWPFPPKTEPPITHIMWFNK